MLFRAPRLQVRDSFCAASGSSAHTRSIMQENVVCSVCKSGGEGTVCRKSILPKNRLVEEALFRRSGLSKNQLAERVIRRGGMPNVDCCITTMKVVAKSAILLRYIMDMPVSHYELLALVRPTMGALPRLACA